MTARQTRRRFVEAAALAVAAPYVVPSSALGNRQAAPANDRIALAHVGVGGRGRALLRGFMQCKDAQCVAFCDPFQDRREACAAMTGGTAYADFREVLARGDIDAVVVATPDHWHVPMANAAAKAKKHAYVEKPLGVSIEQDLACRKLFQENKLVFQYGTQQRSMKHCRFGCELVRSGKIGPVQAIEVVAPNGRAGGSTDPAAVPAGFDYDLWLGPAPQKPYTLDRCKPPGTYWIYDQSIGYLGGWGAHPLDIMVWGSLADLSGPIEAEGRGVIPEQGLYDTVYNWEMSLKLGAVKMTFTPGGDSTKFIGPEGWVQIRRGGIKASPESLLSATLGPGDVHLTESPRHDQNFIDAIKAGRPAISPVEDAVRSDILSHLCDIAVRLGREKTVDPKDNLTYRIARKIVWDPNQDAIVGDAEATRLLHREMRSPWTL